jgi:hypothetical protein
MLRQARGQRICFASEEEQERALRSRLHMKPESAVVSGAGARA